MLVIGEPPESIEQHGRGAGARGDEEARPPTHGVGGMAGNALELGGIESGCQGGSDARHPFEDAQLLRLGGFGEQPVGCVREHCADQDPVVDGEGFGERARRCGARVERFQVRRVDVGQSARASPARLTTHRRGSAARRPGRALRRRAPQR